jgi:polar amino acid transport system substrate-binding protein
VKRRTYSLSLALALIVVASVFSLVLAACGSSGGGSSASPTASASGPAALLPDSIKESGVLRIGSNYTSPPLEYIPEGSNDAVGMDIDLMNKICEVLGVTPKWTGQDWAGLRPALQAKRYDTVIASMGDFTDRQEQVTFVDYLSVGEAALVLKDNASAVTKIEDLADKKVGCSKGTIAQTIAEQANNQLKSAGLAEMKISTFPGDAPGIIALTSGQTFAHILDLPFAAYTAAQIEGGNRYAMVLPNLLGAIPYGISVNKDNMQLAQAIKAALDQMIADGSYKQILDKYGLGDGAVTEAVINGGKTSAGG